MVGHTGTDTHPKHSENQHNKNQIYQIVIQWNFDTNVENQDIFFPSWGLKTHTAPVFRLL